jgi:HK97 gp10 family phage protein
MSFRLIKSSDGVLFLKVKKLTTDVRQGIRKAFYFAGKDFQATAKEEIKRKKTGRVYKYKGRKIAAGAPNDYPANRSGRNRRSVDFKVHGGDEMEFGAGETYSPFLERGTAKMAKRPFLKPSIKKNEQNLRKHLRREIGKSLGKI